MGNLDKALPHFIINNAGISALIGSKFYPERLPQGTTVLPAAVHQVISTNPVQTHGERSFLPRQRYQFTFYGGSYGVCVEVAKAFKAALDAYQGNMGTGDYITEVEACLFKDERSIDEPELGIFWRQQDYLIIWKE